MELLRAFFRITLLPWVRFLYRLRVLHADRLPATGGVLIIANHVSYLDSFILYAACPRPPRFVIVSRYLRHGAIRWFLRLFGAIPITPGKSRDAIRLTAERLRLGDVVCIFPEGQLTRLGVMNGLKKGFEVIARQAGVPVVPVYLHGLWGSIFSGERGRYFKKLPHGCRWPVTVAFGPSRPADQADAPWGQAALLEASVEAFAAMPQLEGSAAAAAVRSLKRRRFALCLGEHGKTVRRLPRYQVLASATALARRWIDDRESLLGDRRVGILLPDGTAPALLNLALVLAGRLPVNLPFPEDAASPAAQESLRQNIRAGGIRTVLSSRAFFSLFQPALGGEVTLLDFGAEIGAVPWSRRLSERFRSLLEPAWLTIHRLQLPRGGGADDGVAWACVAPGGLREFTDRQILAEALRLTSGNWIERGETLFAEESLATLAGSLWCLWLPVLHSHAAVGRSWALRSGTDRIETVCGADPVRRLILSAPLAEALALREEPWHPAIRQRLRSVLVPARSTGERDRWQDLAGRVQSVTGAPVFAYWPGPDRVVAISQADAAADPTRPGYALQPGSRPGSPGKLLPGLAPEGLSLDADGFVIDPPEA